MRTIGISIFSRSPYNTRTKVSSCRIRLRAGFLNRLWCGRTYEGEGGIAHQLTGHRDSIGDVRGRVWTPGKLF